MAKCVFLGMNGRESTYGCSSKKHPSYSSSRGWAYFGVIYGTPDACKNDGQGCPIFKKEAEE